MKWLAALFFSLVALDNGSSASKCKWNARGNITQAARNYKRFVDKLPVPTLEYQDPSAPEFRDMYTYSIMLWAINYMSNLQKQADNAGQELVYRIHKAIAELNRAIKSIPPHNAKPNCLEDVFKQVIRQMNRFLSLKPQNTNFQLSEPVDFPEQPIKSRNNSRPKSPEEIFVNFVQTTDNFVRQVYVYLTTLFLKGWCDVRRDYEIFRTDLYKEILNGPVLDAYVQAVDEVYDRSKVIQSNVSPKTWKAFCLAADHIIAVLKNCEEPDDYEDFPRPTRCPHL